MIVGLTFMAAVVVAAAVGAGWAYKTGRIGGSRDQQYITEDHDAGPVRLFMTYNMIPSAVAMRKLCLS